jgi:uroporphyrinogen decarboxylase
MRQAGRVLPSYMAIKKKYSFWQMMQQPEIAAKVTLLPIHDLNVDAAILFSDILVIPYASGMGLDFTDKGPVFEKYLINSSDPVAELNPDPSKLEYIYNAIDVIIDTRPKNIPLIGFCGAPLTVLLYMLQGSSQKKEFPEAIKYIYQHKRTVQKLVDHITELSIEYAHGQIKHGVEVFQLFESHAGLVPLDLYNELFMPAVKIIARAIRQKNIPFIYFPKGLSVGIGDITPDTCDFLSVDWHTPIEMARKAVHNQIGLQGNLDPRLLFCSQEEIEVELQRYVAFGRQHQDWIFNVGHGFMPGIPVENVKFVVDYMQHADWQRG